MARTPAQAKALEAKALKAENKSEGMRMLFEAGYEVAQVRDIFGVPYGFAYGVAKKAGAITPTPREAKPKAAAKTKAAPAAKAKAAPAKSARTTRTRTAKAKA